MRRQARIKGVYLFHDSVKHHSTLWELNAFQVQKYSNFSREGSVDDIGGGGSYNKYEWKLVLVAAV